VVCVCVCVCVCHIFLVNSCPIHVIGPCCADTLTALRARLNMDTRETVDWDLQYQYMCAEKEPPGPRRLRSADTYELMDAIKKGWRLSHRQAGNLLLWLDPEYGTVPVDWNKAYKLAMKHYNETKKERRAALDSGRQHKKRKESAPPSKSGSIASRAFLRPTASLEARLTASKEEMRIQQHGAKKQKLQLKDATAAADRLRQQVSKLSHERKELKADSTKKSKEIRHFKTAARAEPSARAQRLSNKGKR
jgi:hypothetical protein